MAEDPQGLLDRAIDLKKKKEYEQAWDILISLREEMAGSSFFWSNLAHLAMLMGLFEEGAEYARRGVELKPDNTFARSVFARLLIRLGREQDALEELRIRLEHEFHLQDFRKMMDLAVKLKNLEPAETVFEKWRTAMSKEPGFFQAMGEGYRRLGMQEKAETLYARVLELDPENRFAKRQSVSMKLAAAPSGTGIRELTLMLKLKENRGNDQLMDLLARELKKEKRYEEAAETYRKIIGIKPANLYYRKQLGFVYSKMGDLEAVVQILSPCLEEDPEDRYVQTTLLAAMKRLGRKEEALQLVDRVIAGYPDAVKLHGIRKGIEKWP